LRCDVSARSRSRKGSVGPGRGLAVGDKSKHGERAAVLRCRGATGRASAEGKDGNRSRKRTSLLETLSSIKSSRHVPNVTRRHRSSRTGGSRSKARKRRRRTMASYDCASREHVPSADGKDTPALGDRSSQTPSAAHQPIATGSWNAKPGSLPRFRRIGTGSAWREYGE
jgi:hypothetical protein